MEVLLSVAAYTFFDKKSPIDLKVVPSIQLFRL